jgi:hypothetical protein
LFLLASFVVRAPALLVGSLRVGSHTALRTRPVLRARLLLAANLNEPPLLRAELDYSRSGSSTLACSLRGSRRACSASHS